jgi:hypothetical protein
VRLSAQNRPVKPACCFMPRHGQSTIDRTVMAVTAGCADRGSGSRLELGNVRALPEVPVCLHRKVL